MKRILVMLVALLVSGAAAAALNLNTATKDELVALPGIGPAKAQAIVDYRNQHGPFKSVDEIRKVKGIGEKLFLQIKPELAIGAPARNALAQAPAKADGEAGCESRAARQRRRDREGRQGEEVIALPSSIPRLPRGEEMRRASPACGAKGRRMGQGRRLQCVARGRCGSRGCNAPPTMTAPTYPTLADTVGETPLVRLQRLPGATSNVILGKMEGNNPAGSVKDRPALSMIVEAEKRGEIRPGDTLIEPTSGNTGIALAMVAAMRGYRMILIMPENLSVERRHLDDRVRRAARPHVEGRRHGRRARSRRADGARGQGAHARPVRESGQSAVALPRHRPGAVAADRRADHAFRVGDGDDRHDHGRVALPEGAQSRDPRSSARSPPKARRSRASASGRRRTCRGSSTPRASTAPSRSRSRRRRR